MRSLKINRLLPIYISTLPLKFHYGNQSRGYLIEGRPLWPPAVPRLAARSSQSNPRGSGPEVLKRECGHVTAETGVAEVGVFRALQPNVELIFKAKLKLESGNQKIQYVHQAAILKVTSLKINRLLPMTTINMHMKFEIEIPKQTWLTSRIPCHLQSPETEKSNMAARRPFWKWRCWKSIGSYPYT